jgi:hypothetical protein
MSLLVNLRQIGLPVLNTEVHESAVNEVEWLTIGPLFINIVDLKPHIRRHTGCC